MKLNNLIKKLFINFRTLIESLNFNKTKYDLRFSPFQIVHKTYICNLRRYFPPELFLYSQKFLHPILLMVHPLAISSNIWDTTSNYSSANILYTSGIDLWVIDFKSPVVILGLSKPNISEYILALSEIIDLIKKFSTTCPIYLLGYSQGGILAYQTASYRRPKDLFGIITLGSPVKTLFFLPVNFINTLIKKIVNTINNYAIRYIDVSGRLTRIGFQIISPLKTVKSYLNFFVKFYNYECLPLDKYKWQFLSSKGWIKLTGVMIAELLKQFVVLNDMVNNKLIFNNHMIVLSSIKCPIFTIIGALDYISKLNSIRSIRQIISEVDTYECFAKTGHFGLIVGSKASSKIWPRIANWVKLANKPNLEDILLKLNWLTSDINKAPK